MSRPESPPSTDPTAPGDAVEFAPLAGSDSTSWQRADPDAALIESTGRYGYLVTLPGGDTHRAALAVENAQHVGTCDCQGWEYNDGPCAHLCTLRKAAFAEVEDVRGEPVTLPRVSLDDNDLDLRAATDGGLVDRARRTTATGGRRR